MALQSSDHPRSSTVAFNAWLGAVLFCGYAFLYAGFIYLSAFSRERMAADVISGVNLAVVYGFGLIFAAFAVACIYMLLCRRESAAEFTEPQAKQENQ